MEVEHKVMEDFYKQLVTDLENSDDSASDDEKEDDITREWEAVRKNSLKKLPMMIFVLKIQILDFLEN